MTNRKEHWENVYQQKSPLEVSWYQKQPALSLQLIARTGVSKEQAIIDVGGGASLLIDHLIEAGYQDLSVLDISGNALKVARQRLGEAAAHVEWLECDITTFKPSHNYAVWHDRAVFHFLTDANDRKKYVEVLKQAVMPGGHIIIAAFAIGGPTMCSGLDIVQYDSEKLSKELGDGFTLVDERSETHITPAAKEQAFNFFLLRKQ